MVLILGADQYGIISIFLTYSVNARERTGKEQKANSKEFEYYFAGSYRSDVDSDGQLHGNASTRLFHYNLQTADGKPKMISLDVLSEAKFTLSEFAKKSLLGIMDAATVHGINQPNNTLYKDLLNEEPLRLRKFVDPDG